MKPVIQLQIAINKTANGLFMKPVIQLQIDIKKQVTVCL